MKPGDPEPSPKGEVILTGLDASSPVVVEERISVVDYYESLHPILDEEYAYRAQHGIRYVKGRIYDYDGNLDQEFTNEYDENGVYVHSRIVFADGTVSES